MFKYIFPLLFTPFLLYSEICLVMVVENDDSVIEKSLKSVTSIIDCICICNANSTDDTLSLLDVFKSETHIPLKIIHPEKGQNYRNLAMQEGQAMMQALQFDLSNSYLLFLEPGYIVTNAETALDSALTADAYSSVHVQSSIELSREMPFLFKASLPWKSHHPIYFDWTSTAANVYGQLSSVSILELDEEEYKKNKCTHIVKTLKDAQDTRSLFYLAQAHKALGDFSRAIELHQMHIDHAHSKEESWFSHFMIGACYERMQEWEKALHWYLQTYQYDPDRVESLHKLATYFRQHGQNHLAYLFASHGAKIGSHKHQTLWPIPTFAAYQFDEELSIAAYYTPFPEEGEKAANDLILRKQVPWHVREQTYRNLIFYTHKLQPIRQMPIEFNRPPIHAGSDERFHPMNPSICTTDDGYQVICRTVNYTQTGAKNFSTVDPSGTFRTRNFLLHYDSQFQLQSEKEIIEDLPRKKIRSFNLEGLDDCRIFGFHDGLWFTCNTGDTNPFGTIQISLCKLSEETTHPTVKVQKLLPLKGPDPYRCEKNWLPFTKEGQIRIIYSYDPFIIFTPNLQTGYCAQEIIPQSGYDFAHFRGSAGPILFDDGYLILVHEVVTQPDFSRCYFHRFLYTDSHFVVTKITKPFIFNHFGVEYCCSMTLDRSEKELIVPIGIEDREAYLYFFDCDMIRSLLYPLKENGSHVFSAPHLRSILFAVAHLSSWG